MLEQSYGLTYFLKSPKKKETQIRYVYLRVTVDGTPKETSTKHRWDVRRWDQETGRAIGTKEDAKSLNYFIDSLEVKINSYKTELINEGKTIIRNWNYGGLRQKINYKANKSGINLIVE